MCVCMYVYIHVYVSNKNEFVNLVTFCITIFFPWFNSKAFQEFLSAWLIYFISRSQSLFPLKAAVYQPEHLTILCITYMQTSARTKTRALLSSLWRCYLKRCRKVECRMLTLCFSYISLLRYGTQILMLDKNNRRKHKTLYEWKTGKFLSDIAWHGIPFEFIFIFCLRNKK